MDTRLSDHDYEILAERAVPASIGRLLIIGKIGEGGMGVVYAAYDPELDRKVAVKMLRTDRPGSADSRARLLCEAQALAKLAHPNVVSVHDVGTTGRSVWIAMEFVEGRTVAAWLAERARGWREVVEVFVQAARGVEAAHKAGLLHRDLKPANIMIGDDGRVRVMDFGLVRSDGAIDDSGRATTLGNHVSQVGELTQSHALMGTPAYMAPELHLFRVADTRSDQYSLCVSLWEALYRQRPFLADSLASLTMAQIAGETTRPPANIRVPHWLRRVVFRGLAPRPEARFASVAELRQALEADPTRKRWLLGLTLVAVFGAGAGLAGRQIQHARAIAACDAVGATIDEIWNEDARGRVREGLLAIGVPFATVVAEKTLPWIDHYVESWRETRTDLCRDATVERRIARVSAEKAAACLTEGYHELETIVRFLTEPGSGDLGRGIAENAIVAVSNLPRPEACRDPEASQSELIPDTAIHAQTRGIREKLWESSALERLGAYGEAYSLAAEAREAADRLGIRQMQASAASALGIISDQLGRYEEAEALLELAFFGAGNIGDDQLQVTSARALISVVGLRQRRYPEGLRWGRVAHMILDRAGVADDDFRRMHVMTQIGLVLDRSGDGASAIELQQAALAIAERELGPDHPMTIGVRHNLGLIQRGRGHIQESMRSIERAAHSYEEVLGIDHPLTSRSRGVLATLYAVRGDHARAVELLTDVLDRTERSLGEEHPGVAAVLLDLGNCYHRVSEFDKATAAFSRAYKIRESALGAEHVDTAEIMLQLASVFRDKGALDSAEQLMERALSTIEKQLGAESQEVARVLVNLANVYRAQGVYGPALGLLERALRIDEKVFGPYSPEVATTLHAIGLAQGAQGAYSQAEEFLQRAIEIWKAPHVADTRSVATAFLNLGAVHLASGDAAGAALVLEEARALVEAMGSDRATLALILTKLGQVSLMLGNEEEARSLLWQSLGLRDGSEGDPSKLAETQFTLAQALWSLPQERVHARAMAEAARGGFILQEKRHTREIRDVDRWLRTHRP